MNLLMSSHRKDLDFQALSFVRVVWKIQGESELSVEGV
jgi:hypothetical protein